MTTIKRLLNSFVPSNYTISITPDAEKLTFSGSVKIEGALQTASSIIELHSKKLVIISAQIDGIDASWGEESTHNELEFKVDAELPSGHHTIEISFSGLITKDMSGMYPSDFEHEGKTKRIIATQFESHHARQVFPCVDEPAAKAVFDLTITSPTNQTVLSNTPIASQIEKDDLSITTFESTPKMSTYLLAFAYGDLHYCEGKTATGTAVRSYAAVARDKKLLTYSVNEAVAILEFFEDYFGTPYPLQKLDQLALPDFDAGAMENWGLVTYREVALLADPDNRSVSSEQYVSLVVAHELSHQWFGNLVTMQWWDDLWLNESFASFMEHIALDAIHPNWQQWEHYTAMDVLSTTSRDIHKDIQSISVEVTDPDLIETLFDPGIVYAKGGRLLKMLREFIGDNSFRSALNSYFKEFAYSNADRKDLWNAMSTASGINIDELMTPWLVQPGMPVVSVSQKTTDAPVHLKQNRFIVDGSSDDTLWPIPLLANQTIETKVLNDSEMTIETNADMKPLLLNQYGSGHYLTHYTTSMSRDFLIERIQDKTMPSEGRVNTLNDMSLLSKNGLQPLTVLLNMVISMDNEDRYSVWQLMARSLGTAQVLTEGNEAAKSILDDVRYSIANKRYIELGHEDQPTDSENDIQMRSLLFGLLLTAEDEDAISHSSKLLEKHRNSLLDLPAETRPSILAHAVKHADSSLIDELLKIYPNTDPEMQLDITSALSATKDATEAERILSLALGEKGFARTQDVMRWIVRFMLNRFTKQVAWDFMVENWEWLEGELSSSKAFDFLPTYCASAVTTQEWLETYTSFFTPKLSNKTLKHNITIGLKDATSRVEWRTREEPLILEWLESIKDQVAR